MINKWISKRGEDGYIEPGSPEYGQVLGCSQVADILGFGYGTAQDVWRDKTHRAPKMAHKRIFDRGHAMERYMAEMMVADFGRHIVSEQVQYRDPDRPWLVFHADGMFPTHTPLEEGNSHLEGPGIWEAKAPGSNMAHKMMVEGMTPNYICQMQMGMHVAGVALGIPIQWGTASFLDYDSWETVPFDIKASWDFQKGALAKLDEFWKCVQNDTPPPLVMQEDLPELSPVEGENIIITEGRIKELALELASMHAPLMLAKSQDDRIRKELKELIAPYGRIEVPGIMKATYTYGKPGETIDGAGLLEYCEWLVGVFNAEMEGSGTSPIDFDRSQWVKDKAPVRSFRPTIIGD